MLKSKLENLFNRFNKKHYYSLAGILLLVVIGVFFVVTPAQANNIIDIGTGALNAILRGASYIFLTLAKLAISFTIFALEFFIKVAQYNNYVDAPTVLVGWIMVRDVANMFFVIALLLIAFGTMMGLENYMWTKTLVKLILAAVFINFSNLICGLIIDIAHVFTITFVNAIAGVAGGNLIKMFKMDEILSMSQTGAIKFTEGSDLQLEVLGASITAFIFAMIAFATMVAYLVLMVARLVVLWVLIVLSPLAFVLQTIPSTEQYAKEWWQKFGKQVIVAPVMVFFLWLAFATVGSGDVAVQQSLAPGEKDLVDVQRVIGREQNEPSLSLSKATTWDNMANFLIPIALLIVGLNVVQQIGVVGSGMVGGVVNFGKKVATIASGYAAGRWLAGKVGEGAKKTGQAVAWGFPVIGGKRWTQRARHIGYNVADWAQGLGKTPEEMSFTGKKGSIRGGIQGTVNWFVRRERVMDKELEVRKKLVEEQGNLLGKHATSGVYGAKLRYVKGSIAAYEERSQAREGADVARGKRETLEAERIKTRYIGSYRDPETGEEVGPLISRLLGLTETVRVSEQGAMGSDVVSKKVKERDETMRLDTRKADWEKTFRDQGVDEIRQRQQINNQLTQNARPESLRKLADRKHRLEVELALKREAVMINFSGQLDEINKKQGEAVVTATKDKEAAEKIRSRIMQGDDYKKWIAENHALEIAQLEDESALAKEKDPAKQTVIRTRIDSRKKQIEDHQKLLTDKNGRYGALAAELEPAEEAIARADESISKAKEEADRDRAGITKKAELELEGDGEFRALREEDKEVGDKLIAAEKAWTDSDEGRQALEDVARRKAYNEGGITGLVKHLRDQNSSLSPEDGLKKAQELITSGNYDEMFVGRTLSGSDKPMKAGITSMGAQLSEHEIELGHARASLEATDKDSLRQALGLERLRSIFAATQVENIMKEGAEKFVEQIKQAKLENIFKDGLKTMKKERDLRLEILKKERDLAVAKGSTPAEEAAKKAVINSEINVLKTQADKIAETASVQFVRGNIAQRYATDSAEVEKTKLMDEADSEYTLGRYGYETPSSAFKALIKKKMSEEFEGVEREKAYKMAYDSILHVLKMQEKGEEVSGDQEAMMMASITYLTKQGWSDDLVGEIKRKIKKSASGAFLSGTKEHDEGKLLEKIFVDKLGWGERDASGKLILKNDSDPHHTNSLHRLMGTAGDYNLQASEDVVLDTMEKMGLTYSQAIEHLSSAMRTAVDSGTLKMKDGKLDTMLPDFDHNFEGIAKGLGYVDEAMKRKLRIFAERFTTQSVVEDRTRTIASELFKSQMANYTESFQMLADAKNLALQTGHLDDAGHSYYDVNEGIYRSQTAEDAYNFVLSDWRKLPVNRRLSILKVHSDAAMDEDYGTFEVKKMYKQGRRETYRSADTERVFEGTDGRNTDGMTGFLAAGAVDKKFDSKGLHIMHRGSKLFKLYYDQAEGEFADDADRIAAAEKRAMEHAANNMAHDLDDVLIPHLRALGVHSEVKFAESTRGVLNLVDENGNQIRTIAQYIEWVEKHRTNQAEVRIDVKKIINAITNAKDKPNEVVSPPSSTTP